MAEEQKQPTATTPPQVGPASRTGRVGDPSAYKADKYVVSSTIYPSDLFDSRSTYGDNYVAFYINVPESSYLLADNNDNRLNTVTRDTTELGSAISKVTGEVKEELAKDKKSTGNAIQEGAKSLGLGLRQNKRLASSIILNVPNNLTTRYSVNWDVEDMVLASAAADIVNTIMGKTSAQSSFGEKAGASGKTAVAAAANIGLSKLPGGSAVSVATGVAANPKKEQLFKNVDFRTFNFEYQFAPRNETESRNVQNIIKTFKLHMHPEYKDTGGFLFIYPSEFEIFYYQGDSENMNLPRHTSCVLVDMSVNYTPQGMFNTFNDGASTLITMNLTFKELAILTKSEIEDGF